MKLQNEPEEVILTTNQELKEPINSSSFDNDARFFLSFWLLKLNLLAFQANLKGKKKVFGHENTNNVLCSFEIFCIRQDLLLIFMRTAAAVEVFSAMIIPALNVLSAAVGGIGALHSATDADAV